nr:hypothetical protein TDPV-023 [Oriental turtle dovepox virus]
MCTSSSIIFLTSGNKILTSFIGFPETNSLITYMHSALVRLRNLCFNLSTPVIRLYNNKSNNILLTLGFDHAVCKG